MSGIRGQVQVFIPAAAYTTSGTSGVQIIQAGAWDAATFFLNCSTNSGGTTLDVYLQTSPNTGTTWYDFGRFAQITTAASTIQALQWARRATDATNATGVIVTGDAALAQSKVINGPIADDYFRVKYVMSATTSYTFQVFGIGDRD